MVWTVGTLDDLNFTCFSTSNRKIGKKEKEKKWLRPLLFPEEDELELQQPSNNLHAAPVA